MPSTCCRLLFSELPSRYCPAIAPQAGATATAGGDDGDDGATPRAPPKSRESLSSPPGKETLPSYRTPSPGRSGRLTAIFFRPAMLWPARSAALRSASGMEGGYAWNDNWGQSHSGTSIGTCVAISTEDSHLERPAPNGGPAPPGSSCTRAGPGLQDRARLACGPSSGLALGLAPSFGLIGPSRGLATGDGATSGGAGAARLPAPVPRSAALSLRSVKWRNGRHVWISFVSTACHSLPSAAPVPPPALPALALPAPPAPGNSKPSAPLEEDELVFVAAGAPGLSE
mmetsp:Transcript_48106/g.135898  ORF Transcript_48106/g.135898 Transcript_48106/m.135898 type:complete len:285 (-) Transcript_48106:749-1603(-)